MPPLYTRHFFLLYAAHLTSAFSVLSFVLVPLRIEELGGNEIDIGLVAAMAVGAGIAVRWLSGHLSDHVGRRQVMIGGAALNVISCGALVFVDSLWPAFYFVRALHGMAAGITFATFFTVASDLAPESRRGEGLAVFGTSGIVAGWLGPFLGEKALAAGGFDAFFMMAAIGALLSLGFVALVPETRGPLPAMRLSRRLLTPGLNLAFALTFLFGLSVGSYFNFLAPHLEQQGGLQVSQFFLVYSLAALALRVVGRRLPDLLGVRALLPPAFVSLLGGVALIGWVDGPWLLRLAGLLCGLGHGYVFPLLNTLVVTTTPIGARGLGVSVFTAIIDSGTLVGGPVLGAAARAWGYRAMFEGVAGLGGFVLGAIACSEWSRRRRRPATGSLE